MRRPDPDLKTKMETCAPGFYTERDGGDWYIVVPTHDGRIGEGFRNRDDARRLVVWFAGGEQPPGWTLSPGSRLACDLLVNGQAMALVWKRETRKYFPRIPLAG